MASEPGFGEMPAWCLGAKKIPESAEEWVEWGKRLRAFIGATLGISHERFGQIMGVSRTSVTRWLQGYPANWDNQNILSNLIFYVNTRGVDKAIRVVEENREYLRNFSPGAAHVAELKTLRDRVADLEAALDQLGAVKQRVARLEEHLLTPVSQQVSP